MRLPPVVVICAQGSAAPKELGALDEVASVTLVDDESGLRAAQADAEIAFVWDHQSDLLRRAGAERLAWVHTNSIGLDAVLTPEIVDSAVVVTNTRGVFEPPMAEWVLAALLFFAKDLRRTIESQRAARWDHRVAGAIKGRRVLVLGAGGVGAEIAPVLRAVGMSVDVVGRSERDDAQLGRIHGSEDLDGLLGVADDVVVALPLTTDTRGLVTARRIALMKRGVRIVNVGRGPLIDEQALLEALLSGHVEAAALDVFDTEPLPGGHPFWGLDNVLVSPHMSSDVHGWQRQSVALFIDNLHRWTTKQPLRNVVDKQGFAVGQPAG